MKIFNWNKPAIKTTVKESRQSTSSFAHMNKEDQNKALKKGAEKFSKNFTTVFEKLAKE